MDITIIGSGNMARAIATRFVASGNHVTIVARNADKAAHLAKELGAHAKKGATIKSAVLGSPIPDPIVVFTLWYTTTKEIVDAEATVRQSVLDREAADRLRRSGKTAESSAEDCGRKRERSALRRYLRRGWSGLCHHRRQWPLDVSTRHAARGSLS